MTLDGPRDCRDCGVKPGEKHDSNCCIERCKNCGYQAFSCDCDPYTERTTWTGIYPGLVECEEYGIWTSEEDRRRHGWGEHDLNELSRMHSDGRLVWCSERERLVKPEDEPVLYVPSFEIQIARIADALREAFPSLSEDIADTLARDAANAAALNTGTYCSAAHAAGLAE